MIVKSKTNAKLHVFPNSDKNLVKPKVGNRSLKPIIYLHAFVLGVGIIKDSPMRYSLSTCFIIYLIHYYRNWNQFMERFNLRRTGLKGPFSHRQPVVAIGWSHYRSLQLTRCRQKVGLLSNAMDQIIFGVFVIPHTFRFSWVNSHHIATNS